MSYERELGWGVLCLSTILREVSQLLIGRDFPINPTVVLKMKQKKLEKKKFARIATAYFLCAVNSIYKQNKVYVDVDLLLRIDISEINNTYTNSVRQVSILVFSPISRSIE